MFEAGCSERAINFGDDIESVTQELALETAPARRVGRREIRDNKRGRGGRRVAISSNEDFVPKNAYLTEETKTLTRVGVDTSHNPIINNNQSGDAMWKRIANNYNQIKPPRTP